MTITNPLTYTEAGISLSSLTRIQGLRTRSIDNQQMLIDQTSLNVRKIEVYANDSKVIIRVRDEIIYEAHRNEDEPESEWHSILNHVRHDYVSSMLQDKTDVRMRDLGFNTPLTPDAISEDHKLVVELTTTISDNDRTYESAYKKKILNYQDLCKKHALRLGIIVVGSTQILTNCYVRPDMVSEFCLRLREAFSMETSICDQTGYMPNSGGEDLDMNVKMVEMMMKEINSIQKKETWDFNFDLQSQSLREKTDQDVDLTALKLNESWGNVTSAVKKLPEKDMDDYLHSLTKKETRKDMKRIFNFPAILPEYTGKTAEAMDFLGFSEENLKDESEKAVGHLWREGISRCYSEQKEYPPSVHHMTSMSEAMNPSLAPEEHYLRKGFSFEDLLSDSERDSIALSGPGAKLRREMSDIIEENAHQKKSFDLQSPMHDIENFIKSSTFEGFNPDFSSKSTPIKIIKRSQKKKNRRDIGSKLMDWVTEMSMVRYSSFISEVILELSYEYKTPNKPNSWTCKPMRNYPCLILTRSTGSHIFYSILSKTSEAKVWDTGRLGAQTYECGRWTFSDFGSMVEGSLEHFLKAGPYMAAISAYLLQHFKVPFLKGIKEIPKEYWETMKQLFLIYFNNKGDVENMVMDSRFLYMRILQKFENDPYPFIERMPEVLRSRLGVYYVHRLVSLMKSFRNKPVKQVRIKGIPENDPNSVRFTGLRCVFHDTPIQVDQLIDTFYFSYTVSKIKGKVGDRSLKIVTKIVKEEMWCRDNIAETKGIIWQDLNEPQRQHWSLSMMIVMIDLCKAKWRKIYGDNFESQLNRKIALKFCRLRFSDIATLKASSKDHENPQITLPKVEEEPLTGRDYVKKLKELNPKLDGKRPRVLSELFKLIKVYMNSTGNQEPTLLQILPYCLTELVNRGYIYSDCFDKDQHGGIREIHVLEIKARVVQYFVEKSAECMGHLFKTDSILNPKYKEKFMKEHELHSQATLGDHMTMCKSADATKWCQRHHVSKFYMLMNRLTGGHWDGLYYNVFYLWVNKRISIPEELIAILHTSQFPESDNKTLLWLREKFLSGSMPFVCEDSDTLEIKFGMWQGIWHKVSTVMHSLVQDYFADICRSVLRHRKISAVVTVIQGSDDSACCISYSNKGRKYDALIHILLKWKEEFQKWVSIWPSTAKSSIGTQLFIEYNSEWWYRGKVLKPTFRWVSACLQTSIVESFYERVQIFYSELSTAVEMGLCTLTASVIQKCQAWLHYMMMGFSNHILREEISDLLLEHPSPALGFFPLDGEEYCGITGFDYSLYVLHKENGLKIQEYSREMINPSSLLDYDDKIDKSLKKDLKSLVIGYGNKKIWERIVEEIDIGEMQDALDLIDKDPSRLYETRNTWEDQKMWMILKLFQKGVRTSLSMHQPTIRSAASSAYIFNRPCLSIRKPDGSRSKMSLLKALLELGDSTTEGEKSQTEEGGRELKDDQRKRKALEGDTIDDHPLRLFSNEIEYEDFYSYIQELREGFSFQEVPYGRHSKVTVMVWGEMSMNETPLMDIVKRALFRMSSVPISRTAFRLLWNECKAKYRFLRDTYESTIRESGMDHMQFFDFINTASLKTRKVTLQDTTAKSPHLISSLTRIYWPQIKIRASRVDLETTSSYLRHMLLCTSTFWFSHSQKIELLKSLLLKSNLKSKTVTSVPSRMRRLKLMMDFINTGNKERLLLDIPLAKTGVLGFMLKRQDKSKGKSSGLRYQGEGTWVGEVCGVPTRILIFDDKVKMVKIKFLQDTVVLSKRLKILLDELGVTAEENPLRSSSLYYLNENGHFMASPVAVEGAVPVELEQNLVPLDLEALIRKDWIVEFENSTLRVCYIENERLRSSPKITIISDTFTSRDWAPELTSSTTTWAKSKSFNSYCRGLPCSLLDIMEDFGLHPNREYMKNLLSRMSGNDHVIGNYSTKALRDSFTSYLLQKRGSSLQKQDFLRKVAKSHEVSSQMIEVTDEDVSRFLETTERHTDFSKPLESWAEEVEEHIRLNEKEEQFLEEVDMDDKISQEEALDSLDEFMMSGTNAIIEEVAEMFFSVDLDDSAISYKDFSMLRLMPLENSFWEDTIKVLESETQGKLLLDCMVSGESIPENLHLLSHANFILSIVTRQNLFPDPNGRLSSHAETLMSSSTRDPLVSPEDVKAHVEKLKSNIREVEESWQLFTPIVKEVMGRKKQEWEMQLEAYTRKSSSPTIPLVNYFVFMDTLLRVLKEAGLYDKTDQSSELEVLTTLLLSDVMEGTLKRHRNKLIADNEMLEIKNRLWDRIVTSQLIRTISESLSVGITLYIDKEVAFDHSPKMSLEEVEVYVSLN